MRSTGLIDIYEVQTGTVASKHSIILNSPFLSFLFHFYFHLNLKIRRIPDLNMNGCFSFGGVVSPNKAASSAILHKILRTMSPRYIPEIIFSNI